MDEPVLEKVGKTLLTLLTDAMVPQLLSSRDELGFGTPYEEKKEFRVGVFLYDVRDYSAVGSLPTVRLSPGERQLPPKTVELRYLVFLNRDMPFRSIQAQEEARLLEAVFRAVRDAPAPQEEAAIPKIQFDSLPFSEKTGLWQSMSQPLQPSVYLSAAPVFLPSGRIIRSPVVREISYSYEKKKTKEESEWLPR